MSRLFVFGCSFTQYMWPTWANIVAYDLQMPLYNFGFAGLGNVGIMHRVMEADMKFQFTPEDKIMIMWTSWSRDDYVQAHGMWAHAGSRYNQELNAKKIKQLKTHWSPTDDIVKNSTAIAYVTKLYKDNILWQGHGFDPWVDEGTDGDVKELFLNEEDQQQRHSQLLDFYKRKISKLPVRNLETGNLAFDYVRDSHPDVAEHIDVVQNYIYPCIDYTIRSETIGIFASLHKSIKKVIMKKKLRDLHQVMHIPDGIIAQNYPEIHAYLDIRALCDDISG